MKKDCNLIALAFAIGLLTADIAVIMIYILKRF